MTKYKGPRVPKPTKLPPPPSISIKNFPANPSSPIPIGDNPDFQTLPLGSKFHKKGDDPKNIYELRKSPHGYRYLFCKQNCEFVRETTVSLEFIQIG